MPNEFSNSSEQGGHSDEPNPYKPLQFDIADYYDDLTDEERAQENAEATLEALFHIMGEFVRMGIDVNYMSTFFPELFENSGGLHENMVEQNKNP